MKCLKLEEEVLILFLISNREMNGASMTTRSEVSLKSNPCIITSFGISNQYFTEVYQNLFQEIFSVKVVNLLMLEHLPEISDRSKKSEIYCHFRREVSSSSPPRPAIELIGIDPDHRSRSRSPDNGPCPLISTTSRLRGSF